MRDENVYGLGALFVEGVGSECKRLAGINHVVYQNGDL